MSIIGIEGRGSAVPPSFSDELAARRAMQIQEQQELAIRRSFELHTMAELTYQCQLASRHPLALYDLLFTDDRGEPLSITKFHKEWSNLLLQYPRVLLEAARGTGKTTFINAFVAWCIGQNPDIRITLLCENDTQAEKRLSAIKAIVRDHQLYHWTFPHIRIDTRFKDTQSQFTVHRERTGPHPTVEAKGITSAGTGNRSDLMILDDAVGYRSSIQYPKLREETIQKYLNDWAPTLNPRDGRFVSIFTPWTKTDLNAYLKTKELSDQAYLQSTSHQGLTVHRRYAHGAVNNPYHTIFPQLFSDARLRAERNRIGSTNYARAYLCECVPDEAVLIPEEYLAAYTRQLLPPSVAANAICILSMDPASGKEAQRTGQLDYTGFCLGLVVPGNQPRVYIAEAFRLRAPLKMQAKIAVEICNRWAVAYLLCEAPSLADLHTDISELAAKLSGTSPARATQIVPIVPTPISKGQRLQSVTPLMEPPDSDEAQVLVQTQTVLFHPKLLSLDLDDMSFSYTDGSGTTHECQRTLRTELLDFPTKHDDVMDAYVQLLTWVRTNLLDGGMPDVPGVSTGHLTVEVM